MWKVNSDFSECILSPFVVWLEPEIPTRRTAYGKCGVPNRLCQEGLSNETKRSGCPSERKHVIQGPQVTWRPAVCPEIGWFLDIRRDCIKWMSKTWPAPVTLCGCSRNEDMKRWGSWGVRTAWRQLTSALWWTDDRPSMTNRIPQNNGFWKTT